MSDQEGQSAGSNRPKTISRFLNPARYARLVSEASQRLKQIVRDRHFLVTSSQSDVTGAKAVPIPKIHPCFEIRYACRGKPCDRIKTPAAEVLCLTARNPYTNVTLKHLRIIRFVVTDAAGNPVPTLPDGTPTVAIIPSAGIYFGDLPPSTPTVPSAVTREVTLRSRSAKKGDYLFDLSYDFSVEFVLYDQDRFSLPLLPS